MSKAILLFSGGLDSILAARLLEAQNVEPICVHFTTPFFGDAPKVNKWRKLYNLNVITQDIGKEFVNMLRNGPEHGYGKNLNPCVDCKILFCNMAKKLMDDWGADFLASGEVLGQRPMSQRRDTLNLIQNKAGVAEVLVRPLSAKALAATLPEKSGLLNRDRLEGISGRGRNRQLQLADDFHLKEIPSPAGGCKLTEKENTRRFWRLLKNGADKNLEDLTHDFKVAGLGRMFFYKDTDQWIVMGRNRGENERIARNSRTSDALIQLAEFSGPLCLARNGASWAQSLRHDTAEILASYSPHATASGKPVRVLWRSGNSQESFVITPGRKPEIWAVPSLEQTRAELKEARKKWLENKKQGL